MSDDGSDDEYDEECPLCMEELGPDDMGFYPCPCRYQICRFCWHRIRNDEGGLCPACRRPYEEEPAEYAPLTVAELMALRAEKKKMKAEKARKKEKDAVQRRQLSNLRVVQKNLVYVVGLPQRVAMDEALLWRHDFFGKFGKILKVSVNKSTPHAAGPNPSVSAYITFARKRDAANCVRSVDKSMMEGKVLRASFGTTKYCSNFLRNQPCQNPNCMYLHELGDDASSYTKQDMAEGKHSADVQVVGTPPDGGGAGRGSPRMNQRHPVHGNRQYPPSHGGGGGGHGGAGAALMEPVPGDGRRAASAPAPGMSPPLGGYAPAPGSQQPNADGPVIDVLGPLPSEAAGRSTGGPRVSAYGGGGSSSGPIGPRHSGSTPADSGPRAPPPLTLNSNAATAQGAPTLDFAPLPTATRVSGVIDVGLGGLGIDWAPPAAARPLPDNDDFFERLRAASAPFMQSGLPSSTGPQYSGGGSYGAGSAVVTTGSSSMLGDLATLPPLAPTPSSLGLMDPLRLGSLPTALSMPPLGIGGGLPPLSSVGAGLPPLSSVGAGLPPLSSVGGMPPLSSVGAMPPLSSNSGGGGGGSGGGGGGGGSGGGMASVSRGGGMPPLGSMPTLSRGGPHTDGTWGSAVFADGGVSPLDAVAPVAPASRFAFARQQGGDTDVSGLGFSDRNTADQWQEHMRSLFPGVNIRFTPAGADGAAAVSPDAQDEDDLAQEPRPSSQQSPLPPAPLLDDLQRPLGRAPHPRGGRGRGYAGARGRGAVGRGRARGQLAQPRQLLHPGLPEASGMLSGSAGATHMDALFAGLHVAPPIVGEGGGGTTAGSRDKTS